MKMYYSSYNVEIRKMECANFRVYFNNSSSGNGKRERKQGFYGRKNNKKRTMRLFMQKEREREKRMIRKTDQVGPWLRSAWVVLLRVVMVWEDGGRVLASVLSWSWL